MIRRDQIDFPAFRQKSGVLDRHLSGYGRARAADIGVEAGLIAKTSDLDDFVQLTLRECASTKYEACSQRQDCDRCLHLTSQSLLVVYAYEPQYAPHLPACKAGRDSGLASHPRVSD